MGSWRAHIGKVSPSRGDNYTYEFYRIVPENILFTNALSPKVRRLTPDNLSEAFSGYEEAALTLAEEGAEVIILGGGPVLLNQGAEGEKALCARIEKTTSVPVITELAAAAEGCHALKIKRLAILSPFQDWLNDLHRAYFEGKGYPGVWVRGLGVERNLDIAALPEKAAFDLTMKVFREGPEVDGYYLTCPRWRTATSIAALEKETGKPVVTSVQAAIWKAFKILGIKDRISGYGSLLSNIELRNLS